MVNKSKCEIRAETKLRNGYPNWWCYTHYASARGEKGSRLRRCSKANDPEVRDDEKAYVDLDDYSGGVGIWGSLEAVFDSKREVPEKGVHVHLRRMPEAEKEVDKTFKEVFIKVPSNNLYTSEEWIKIDEYTARAYTASAVFEKKLKIVKCKHCGKEHIDAGYFAIHPHRKHFCTFCGRDFIDVEHGISNPIYSVHQIFNEKLKDRQLTKVDRRLVITQNDYPGGVQIWGSNPAIIWTAKRSEEAGIHVHLFKQSDAPPTSDDTYGYVQIDGIELDDVMIRYYMVQKSLTYLNKFIQSLICPKCLKDHFDIGDNALNPHKIHLCEYCGHTFSDKTRFKGTVSNPIVERLRQVETARKNAKL